MVNALGQHQSKLSQETPNLVGLGCTCLNETLPDSVDRQYALLLDILDRHEPHIWPAYCFTDGLSIGRVVLVGLHIGR